MSRARRFRIVNVLMASMVAGFVTLAACSNQGEGERCQVENGNDDCESGLVCLARNSTTPFNGGQGFVNPGYNSADRCCPFDRSTATHPACVLLSTTITGDGAAPPPDTGPTPDATVDSPADTSTTPDADAATDADAGD